MLMLDQCVSFQWEIGLREKDQLLSTFGVWTIMLTVVIIVSPAFTNCFFDVVRTASFTICCYHSQVTICAACRLIQTSDQHLFLWCAAVSPVPMLISETCTWW